MADEPVAPLETASIAFTFPCIKASQPVGDLYIASLSYKVLCTIADFDVRRVLQEQRDVEKYLGIQRELNKNRVKEIEEYVNFSDACFPGSIIISVDERAAEYDADKSQMTLRNLPNDPDPVLARRIARVIDGQHRIAGLYKFRGENFECPVTILIGMDLADQAQIFARVNLTQTKVNPSLAYDLYELAQTRMPVAAHDDHIGGGIRSVREDRGRYVDVGRCDALDGHFKTMAGEVLTKIGTGHFVLPGRFVGDDDDLHLLCFFQKWH